MKKKFKILPIFIPNWGCKAKCVFCNQREITQSFAEIENEIENKVKNCCGKIDELAFYGGSFTNISIEKQRRLLESVNGFVKSNLADIRISAYPENLSDENILLLKEYNVRTVELGIQSLDADVLSKSGRFYDISKVEYVSQKLKTNGIKLGHQIMIGLPESSPEIEFATLKKIISISPDFLRIYPVVVVKNTELERMYERGEYKPLKIDEIIERCVKILNMIEPTKIKVIRIGLHSEINFTSNSLIDTGSYSPSLGEEVKSDFIFSRILKIIKNSCNFSKFNVKYHPSILSLIFGKRNYYLEKYKKMNINFIKTQDLSNDEILVFDGDNTVFINKIRIP